jgi:hypothetical protein
VVSWKEYVSMGLVTLTPMIYVYVEGRMMGYMVATVAVISEGMTAVLGGIGVLLLSAVVGVVLINAGANLVTIARKNSSHAYACFKDYEIDVELYVRDKSLTMRRNHLGMSKTNNYDSRKRALNEFDAKCRLISTDIRDRG